MAFKFSTGFRDAVNTANPVNGVFGGSVVRVYSAPTEVPVTADAALPADAVLLCEYSNDGAGTGLNLASTSSNGSITKDLAQVWKGTAAATGTAAFFRVVQPADAGAASATDTRIQGTVGVTGADMNVANTTFTSGQEYTIDFFTLTFFNM